MECEDWDGEWDGEWDCSAAADWAAVHADWAAVQVDFEAIERDADAEADYEAVRQRGVVDADLEPGEELRLSPMFPVIDGPHLDISAQERMKIFGSKQGQESSDCPCYLMVSSVAVIEACAAATSRLDARSLDSDVPCPGTGFPVSGSIYCSAKHMAKDDAGNALGRFRAMFSPAFRPEKFSKSTTPRAFLACKTGLPELQVPNWDPIQDDADSYLQNLDVGFWSVTEQDLFCDVVKPERVHAFEKFWLPASIDQEAGKGGSPPCAMLSYPSSSTVTKLLKDDPKQLVKKYSFLVHDRYLEENREKGRADKVDESVVTSDSRYTSFREELQKKLSLEILSALSETFSTFNDGDMMLSVGRLLKRSSTMVATSLSSLRGSSGAPIFLLKPCLERMFVAVHNGAPLGSRAVSAGYNLGTSTNNPSFALQYFTDVIETIPTPDHPSWTNEQERRRLEAFTRWLVQNLATFKQVTELNSAQKAWMDHAESRQRSNGN